MPNPVTNKFAELGAPFAGFIGAIDFAALVLILQNPTNFETNGYGENWLYLLVFVISLILFLSLFGSLGYVYVASGYGGEKLEERSGRSTGFAVGGMIFAVSMLVAPTNLGVSVIVGLVGILIFFWLFGEILCKGLTGEPSGQPPKNPPDSEKQQ